MNLKERAKEVVVDNNGIAKSADFVAAGIRAVDVVNLCNAAFLIVYDTDTISLPNKVFLQKNNCLQHSSQKE